MWNILWTSLIKCNVPWFPFFFGQNAPVIAPPHHAAVVPWLPRSPHMHPCGPRHTHCCTRYTHCCTRYTHCCIAYIFPDEGLVCVGFRVCEQEAAILQSQPVLLPLPPVLPFPPVLLPLPCCCFLSSPVTANLPTTPLLLPPPPSSASSPATPSTLLCAPHTPQHSVHGSVELRTRPTLQYDRY